MGKTNQTKTRRKRKSHKSKKIGMPPGSLIYLGDKENKVIDIDVISYNENSYDVQKAKNADDALAVISPEKTTWINVNGLGNIDEIKKLGYYAHLNNLFIEDLLDTEHRPKIEVMENSVMVIFKMLYYKEDQLILEHLVLLLGENYIISLQEVEGDDVFQSIRKRIENENSPIRKRKSDYLLFGLLDAIVDHYFVILDKISDLVENIEDEILNNPRQELIFEIQGLKKDAIILRKSIHPAREVVIKLEKSDINIIQPDTNQYFRDLYEHTIHIVETLDTYRDMLWGLTDTYMGSVSNKMNTVMRLLTIISTIFIPLTFIVGVYGMNFEFMPELHYKWGYPVVWLVMISITVGMILYFKQKKWL